MYQTDKHSKIIYILINLSRVDKTDINFADKLSTLSPEEIAEEAQRQGVAPWVYNQITKYYSHIPQLATLAEKHKISLLHTTMSNELNIKLYNEIEALLSKQSIQTVALKGIALVISLYPSTSLRPIGDIDLGVSTKNVFEARDILLANGAVQNAPPLSSLHEQAHAHVRSITYKGRLIELHQRLYHVGNKLNIKTDLTDVSVPFTYKDKQHYKLPDYLMAYHLTTHLAHNIRMGGCRLSWFVDIALLFSKSANKANELYEKMIAINSKAKPEIDRVISLAMSLMDSEAIDSLQKSTKLASENITAEMLTESPKISANHKKMVIQNILNTPGISNKTTLIFRELFPSKEYINYFYRTTNGSKLFNAYIRRLFRAAR